MELRDTGKEEAERHRLRDRIQDTSPSSLSRNIAITVFNIFSTLANALTYVFRTLSNAVELMHAASNILIRLDSITMGITDRS